MKKKIIASLITTALCLPFLAFAASASSAAPLDVFGILKRLINLIWTIFFGLSIIAFIYAGILFVWGGSNSSKIGQAKEVVIWGTVGMCVALLGFSIQSIVASILFTYSVYL